MQLTEMPRRVAMRSASALRATPLEGPARALRRAWWGVSGRVPQHERYDRETAEIIARVASDDSRFVDIGAHRGAILEVMVREAPQGSHFAFEPLPGYAERLAERFPDVDIRSLALADAPGELAFTHVLDAPAYSGLRDRADAPAGLTTETITVRVSTLDDELDADAVVDLIKIDVEGAELQVLQGARRTLETWKPYVVFEHGLGGADAYNASPGAVYDVFAESGLRVSRMADWLAGEPALSRNAFIAEFEARRNYVFLAHPDG